MIHEEKNNTFYLPEQVPLDVKGIFKDLDDMRNPGTLKYERFYSYYSGMLSIDASTGTYYVWRERRLSDDINAGVLDTDFQYPENRDNFLYDYAGKYFNFFPFNRCDFCPSDIITGEIITFDDGDTVVGPLNNLGSGTPPFFNLEVYVNGLLQREGATEDYTVDYTTGMITFTYPLSTSLGYTDKVTVNYIINNNG